MGELTDFLNFEPFNDLRKQMGATQLGNVPLIISKDIVSLEEERTLENSGIDIESLDEIRPLKDGTLVYKNKRVIVYIRDVSGFNSILNLPKFHIAWCDTLEKMKNGGRYKTRYVISTREDGVFEIRKARKRSYENLKVCRNCLSRLYKNYNRRNKNEIYNNFTLKEFFTEYSRSPLESKTMPRHTDVTAPTNEYSVADWKKISKAHRESDKWVCQKCKINLHKQHLRKYLHTHHIDGAKYNNDSSNLEVLCIECHAEQFHHQHMKLSFRYKEFKELKAKGQLNP